MRVLLTTTVILGFALVMILGLLSVGRELFAKNPCLPSPVVDDKDAAPQQ